MKYGLNDDVVKRIAAVAFHTSKGSVINKVSNIYNNLGNPDVLNTISNAHMTDAMRHRFINKDEENYFKVHLAKSAAINRGTLDPVPSPQG